MVAEIANRRLCNGCGCRGKRLAQGTSTRTNKRTEERDITAVGF